MLWRPFRFRTRLTLLSLVLLVVPGRISDALLEGDQASLLQNYKVTSGLSRQQGKGHNVQKTSTRPSTRRPGADDDFEGDAASLAQRFFFEEENDIQEVNKSLNSSSNGATEFHDGINLNEINGSLPTNASGGAPLVDYNKTNDTSLTWTEIPVQLKHGESNQSWFHGVNMTNWKDIQITPDDAKPGTLKSSATKDIGDSAVQLATNDKLLEHSGNTHPDRGWLQWMTRSVLAKISGIQGSLAWTRRAHQQIIFLLQREAGHSVQSALVILSAVAFLISIAVFVVLSVAPKPGRKVLEPDSPHSGHSSGSSFNVHLPHRSTHGGDAQQQWRRSRNTTDASLQSQVTAGPDMSKLYSCMSLPQAATPGSETLLSKSTLVKFSQRAFARRPELPPLDQEDPLCPELVVPSGCECKVFVPVLRAAHGLSPSNFVLDPEGKRLFEMFVDDCPAGDVDAEHHVVERITLEDPDLDEQAVFGHAELTVARLKTPTKVQQPEYRRTTALRQTGWKGGVQSNRVTQSSRTTRTSRTTFSTRTTQLAQSKTHYLKESLPQETRDVAGLELLAPGGPSATVLTASLEPYAVIGRRQTATQRSIMVTSAMSGGAMMMLQANEARDGLGARDDDSVRPDELRIVTRDRPFAGVIRPWHQMNGQDYHCIQCGEGVNMGLVILAVVVLDRLAAHAERSQVGSLDQVPPRIGGPTSSRDF